MDKVKITQEQADDKPQGTQIRDLYESHKEDPQSSTFNMGFDEGVRSGIEKTLKILEIKIEGVNF